MTTVLSDSDMDSLMSDCDIESCSHNCDAMHANARQRESMMLVINREKEGRGAPTGRSRLLNLDFLLL
jgi:hypothetical protein